MRVGRIQMIALTPQPLADCPQVEHSAEVGNLVGDGTWLTTTEAALLMGCSKSHVIALIRRGDLPATTAPGSRHRRILRTVAEAYRDKMAAEAAGE